MINLIDMNQPLAYTRLPTFLNHNAGQKTTYFFCDKNKKIQRHARFCGVKIRLKFNAGQN